MRRTLLLASLPLSLSLATHGACAQTEVSGDQSGLWQVANSPYLVVGDILIRAGDTLAIEPGVEVIFQGRYRLAVNGNLQAVGETGNPITFMADSPSSGWRGIRFIGADPASRLSHCEIRHGRATGDWPDNCGGGVSLWESSIAIDHCEIAESFANQLGGGLFCWSCEPSVEYSIFHDNDCSFDGGAIHLYFADASISHCDVVNNTTSYYGAGFAVENSNPEITYCLIANNHAQIQAGAVQASWSDPIITNCTLTGNTAIYGGAVYLSIAEVICTNSILWDNAGIGDDIFLDFQATAVVNYCDIVGNWGGVGNIAEDPAFRDTGAGDFRLTEGSPCVDVGTAFFIFEGDTLVNLSPDQYDGAAPDMGAFEFIETTSVDYAPGATPGLNLLHPSYPNPFNPTVRISYHLSVPGDVELTIYDILGRRVCTPVREPQPSGNHETRWDGLGTDGQRMPSGTYLLRLTIDGRVVGSRRATLIR